METRMNDKGQSACDGNACFASIDSTFESIACQPAGSTCLLARFLSAEPSKFHDQTLIEATEKIQRILASIPADPQGRKLSMLVTKMGVLLAWVYHEERPEGSYSVTLESDDATVIEALKLKI
ncbi:MAG: hypothetical protein V7641_3228 [Blastocatellia bacterium]